MDDAADQYKTLKKPSEEILFKEKKVSFMATLFQFTQKTR
tara:strand:+ start:82698 stop:82817 length:120 start_codon:yes stop_codon:yes gene_type:complete